MGGPGSGNPGQARGAGGRFVISGAITIATAEAVEDQTKKLTEVLDRNSDALDENSNSLERNTQEKGENNDKTGDSIEDLDTYAINLQVATSALNQSTGALMKMVSGLEAWGAINEDTASMLQDQIRKLEFFTGALELGLAVTLLLNFAGYSLTGMFAGATTAAGGAATAMGGFATATYAALAPFAPIILAVVAFVAVIIFLLKYVDEIDAMLGKFRDSMSGVFAITDLTAGVVTGLASNLKGLGDALTNNPITGLLSKAGVGF
jgi:ABC-type multidrug transport system fused ATPase/permease subunit